MSLVPGEGLHLQGIVGCRFMNRSTTYEVVLSPLVASDRGKFQGDRFLVVPRREDLDQGLDAVPHGKA